MEREDDGTYTLYFSTSRGIDKSDYVILKAASSSHAPSVAPNIKVFDKDFDWGSYANVVRVRGGEDGDGNPINEVVYDNDAITEQNGEEFWISHYDPEITTVENAQQTGAEILSQRSSVVYRISVDFMDGYDTTDIEIGDTVMVYVGFDDADFEIAEALRVISLHRSWGVGGEQVSAELTNVLRSTLYFNYEPRITMHDRVLTA
jgi:hypothetical protein